jgi:hypothetical protein
MRIADGGTRALERRSSATTKTFMEDTLVMLPVSFRSLAVAVVLLAATGPAAANAQVVIQQIFEGKHLKLTKQGSEIKYRFQRSVSHEKVLGAAFSDDIKLDVVTVKDDDKRDFEFQVFTGERARDPFADHDRVGNPLLLWYLDRSVNNYKALAGGGLTYVKGRFMEALRNATAEATKVDVGGQSVDGFRVTLTPYAKDPNAARMMGYENSRFVIVYSDAVPGYFVEMSSVYENKDQNAPRLEERLNFVGEGEKK